jgi:HPt (histidine-containing phosphotransfer) domain-containing protein
MTARAESLILDIDEARLAEMLALVGPACEQNLLRSLICDLRSARARLLQAVARRDRTVMRDQTHVLASLAGTFGAVALNEAAQELDARNPSGTAGVDASRVIHRIDRLIADLSARLAERAR